MTCNIIHLHYCSTQRYYESHQSIKQQNKVLMKTKTQDHKQTTFPLNPNQLRRK